MSNNEDRIFKKFDVISYHIGDGRNRAYIVADADEYPDIKCWYAGFFDELVFQYMGLDYFLLPKSQGKKFIENICGNMIRIHCTSNYTYVGRIADIIGFLELNPAFPFDDYHRRTAILSKEEEQTIFKPNINHSLSLKERYDELTKYKYTPINRIVYNLDKNEFKRAIDKDVMKLLPFDVAIIKTKDKDIPCVIVRSKRYSGGLIHVVYIPIDLELRPINFRYKPFNKNMDSFIKLKDHRIHGIYFMEERDLYPTDIYLLSEMDTLRHRNFICEDFEYNCVRSRLQNYSDPKYHYNVAPIGELNELKKQCPYLRSDRSYDPDYRIKEKNLKDQAKAIFKEQEEEKKKPKEVLLKKIPRFKPTNMGYKKVNMVMDINLNNRPWEMPHHIMSESDIEMNTFSNIIYDMCYNEKYDHFITQNMILNNVDLAKQFLNDYRSLSFIHVARAYPKVDIKDTVQKIINKYKVARN